MCAVSSDPQVFLVIKNLFVSVGRWAMAGDLHLTDEGVYYIPYSQHKLPEPEGAAGEFVEGFVEGVAARGEAGLLPILPVHAGHESNPERKAWRFRAENGEVNVGREQWFGVSLRERVAAIEGTVYIARDSLESIRVVGLSASVDCTTRFGETVSFRFGETVSYAPSAIRFRKRRMIRRYWNAPTTLTPLEPSPLGFTTSQPIRPVDALKMLGQDVPANFDGLRGITRDAAWIESFHTLLAAKSEEEIRRICKEIKQADVPWRGALLSTAEATIKRHRSLAYFAGTYGSGIFFTFISLFLIAYGITEERGIPFIVFGSVCLVMGVSLLVAPSLDWFIPVKGARFIVGELTESGQDQRESVERFGGQLDE
jgi:hypothetical protein